MLRYSAVRMVRRAAVRPAAVRMMATAPRAMDYEGGAEAASAPLGHAETTTKLAEMKFEGDVRCSSLPTLHYTTSPVIRLVVQREARQTALLVPLRRITFECFSRVAVHAAIDRPGERVPAHPRAHGNGPALPLLRQGRCRRQRRLGR